MKRKSRGGIFQAWGKGEGGEGGEGGRQLHLASASEPLQLCLMRHHLSDGQRDASADTLEALQSRSRSSIKIANAETHICGDLQRDCRQGYKGQRRWGLGARGGWGGGEGGASMAQRIELLWGLL